MNILITGINGFIGNAVRNFLAEYYSIYGISRSNNENTKNIFAVDLSDSVNVNNFIQKEKSDLEFDVLIHLASKMASPNNTDDISILNENAHITHNALLIAKHFKVKHFINFSSTSIYPNIDGLFDENSRIDPAPNTDCIYGLSKFNSEVLVDYFFKNSDIKISHLRCAMVFSDHMETSRIYPTLKSELINEGEATLFGNGERIINYIFIEELLKLLKQFIQNEITGTFNVVKYSESLLKLAERICEKENISEPKFNLLSKGNKNQFVVDGKKLNKIIENI